MPFWILASPRFGPHFREGHRGSIFFKYLKVSEFTLKPSSALGGHGRSKYDPMGLVSLPYGVPQGSVLGPIFCTIYSSPIASIARKHGLYVHAYADNTQLYTPFDLNDPSDEMLARQRVETCMLEIKSWMSLNKLKLNGEKTEFLVMTSRYQQHKSMLMTSKLTLLLFMLQKVLVTWE